jgi:AraC-like DNA-binding protein
MTSPSGLSLAPSLGLEVVSCGLFISSGRGMHPDRVLDNYELIVVRKGTLSIFEEETRFDVPAGHALLLHAGRRHRGAVPFPSDLRFYWIHFVIKPHVVQGGLLGVPKFTRVQRPECVAELFHRYLDDQEARRLDPLYSALLLTQVVCELGREQAHAGNPRSAALVGRAEAHVTGHLTEKLSTTRIARALHVNPDYLNRAFRQVHRMTMTEYLHRRRLGDAATMLRETTLSIAEIAGACGCPSVGHFRRLFLRFRGISPTAYRQLMARAYVNAM